MRSRVDGEIICYMITIHTTSSLKLGVPRPSFIGLCSALSLVVTLQLRQQNCVGATHHVLVGSLLLVALLQPESYRSCLCGSDYGSGHGSISSRG